MVIAFGSYPKGRRFESHRRYQLTILIWSHGQVVKTLPFHGGDRGSNPLGTTTQTLTTHAKQHGLFFFSTVVQGD